MDTWRNRGMLFSRRLRAYVRNGMVLCGMLAVSIVSGQTLEQLLQQGLENSPEIKKYELQYELAQEQVNAVNTIPNTEFGAGYFVSEPETRTGPQRFKLSVKQMVPWFGSITARENYASAMANAQYEDVAIAQRKLVAGISKAYFNLQANIAKKQVLQENMELLTTYESLAMTSLEVGKASAVDVFRLQMRQNELEQLRQVLEQQYLAEQAELNQLLDREVSAAINPLDLFEMAEEQSAIDQEGLKLHPELVQYDRLYESVAQSELLNQKEASPMIGFGLDYINVSPRADMDVADNGKDIVMPMVSVSIPIFNKKFTSVSKQNKIKQQRLEASREERYNLLEAALQKAIHQMESARISYTIQAKNLGQAKNAEQLLLKSYETETMDFNDVLEIQELQLKFQMGMITSTQTYLLQRTTINYLCAE